MAILTGDIKLLASQVMDDVPEGGGAPTSVVIADGVSNSIFNDISELDRAGGRVNLRKTFVSIQTETQPPEGYFGANVIVAEGPLDPNVSVSLFSTSETFDERVAAVSRIESYLARGPAFAGYIFGNHIAGQRTLTFLARIEAVPPVVGDTLDLVKLPGTSSESEQFVRVTSIERTVRTFTDDSGDFQRAQIVAGLSDALRQDFPGFDAIRSDASINYTGKTKLFETIVADAARYYGVTPLATHAAVGDYVLQATSIFSQIVPSAQIETPVADARMNQQLAALIAAGSLFTQSLTLNFTKTQSMYIGGSILPGSLNVSRGGQTIIDRGGILLNQADLSQVGTIDYANGVLALTVNIFGTTGGTHTVSYIPAATPVIVSESASIVVTQATQRLTYVVSLTPIPAKATLNVSYRYQGRWYVLSDDGSGALRGGDSSVGVGTVNFTTGTVSLTLGALPDVSSEVILNWGPAATVQPRSAVPVAPQSLDNRVFIPMDFARAIKPGTLTITWNDGSARTATDDSQGGFTGSTDAIGEISYANGYVRLSPNTIPAKGTVFSATLVQGSQQSVDVSTFSDGGATWGFTLTGPVRPGALDVAMIASGALRQFPGVDQVRYRFVRLFDDTAGNIKIASLDGNITVGTVNYSTGVCAINKTVSGFKEIQPTYTNSTPITDSGNSTSYIKLSGIENRTIALTMLATYSGSALDIPPWAWWSGSFGVAAKAKYVSNDLSGGTTFSLTLSVLNLRFAAQEFKLGSDIYVRRAGNIVLNPNPVNGEGTAAGTIYGSATPLQGPRGETVFTVGGYVEVSAWSSGVSAIIVYSAGVVGAPLTGQNTLSVVDGAVFRTALSPIKNGSFSVAGSFVDSVSFSATADSTGVINTGTASSGSGSGATPGSRGVFGKINYQTGVAKVRFGRKIDPFFVNTPGVIDMSDLGIAGLQFVKVEGVVSDSLRYNASAYTYLPLDAAILGIDPVRLPSNGKVPIFRAGSFVVIGNKLTTSPATVSNSQTVNLGRTRLSRVRVIGNDGLVINTGYTTDLDAGTVTFTSVSGYSQPVRIEHRVEDMLLCSDAQISGQLTFTRPVTHDFPATTSYVSSALVIGDMKARYEHLFDQATYAAGVWADAAAGSTAAATYNDVLAPITVSNIGALTERWALHFTNSTQFEIVGEHVGIIATGSTSVDQSPINPSTGEPYFTVHKEGWGSGWVNGNVLRFNTVGAEYPVWLVRTIQQGPETVEDDSFTVLIRGDVDHP